MIIILIKNRKNETENRLNNIKKVNINNNGINKIQLYKSKIKSDTKIID